MQVRTKAMKKLFVASIMFSVCVLYLYFLNVDQIDGAETLKITKDHIEFREEPKVAEENLLGTLRIGTSVEWTGNTSGDWFEVQAPNGQTGWVHKSGLSAPRSLPKIEEKPTPMPKLTSTPKPTTSQPVSRAVSTELQKKISQLEKAEAQLEEKDKRISELTGELGQLEQKLTDTAQLLDDTDQLRKMEKVKLSETQTEMDELKKTLEQKEEMLNTEKVEVIKLRDQLRSLQEQLSGAGSLERSLLYAVSIPLNIIGIILLSSILYRQQKKKRKTGIKPDISHKQKEHGITEQPIPEQEQQVEILSAMGSKLGEPATVMAAGPEYEPVIIKEEEIVDEDVIIDLADVLSLEQKDQITGLGKAKKSDEEAQKMEIIAEELPESEAVTETSGEEIEEIGEVEAVEEIEEVGELEEIEAIREIGEIEEVEAAEETEEVGELEEIEAIREIGELEEIEEVKETGEVEEVEKIETETLAEEQEEDLGDFDYDAIYPEEVSEKVEIAGEKFEMFVEQTTQIIESEEGDEEQFEEELVPEGAIEEPEEIEEIEESYEIEEIEEIEGMEGIEELAEDIEELEETEDIEEVGDLEEFEESQAGQEIVELLEDMDEFEEVTELEELEEIQDVEEVENIEEIEDIGEVGSGDETFEPAIEQSTQEFEPGEQLSPPTLLEPEPVLIEPEYEPTEPLFDKIEEKVPESVPSAPEATKEPKYDIELINVGEKREQILHILSKIEGLTKSPQELVDSVPSVIARGAKESDAKNFQIVMKKFGSKVRLIKR
jgi:SH3-like domain-containing protein